jgi:hypothetical protein
LLEFFGESHRPEVSAGRLCAQGRSGRGGSG